MTVIAQDILPAALRAFIADLARRPNEESPWRAYERAKAILWRETSNQVQYDHAVRLYVRLAGI